MPKKIELIYSNDYVALTKTVIVENTSYPMTISWALTPLKTEIFNASLYLSTFFDLKYDFDKAQIPQLLDWVNPWDAPSPIKTVHETDNKPDWAVASFANTNLKDNYIGLYDDTNDVAFAFKFSDLPDWGNIGVLESRQIDGVRFQYQLGDLNVNQTNSKTYQVLTMSKNSLPNIAARYLAGNVQPQPRINAFRKRLHRLH